MSTASGRSARMPADVDGVVAVHHRLGPQLAQLLDQVVDEGVVVVDDQHPGAHGRPIVPNAGRRPEPVPPLANLVAVATSTKGPGGASRKGKSAAGRTDVEGRPLQDGRGERAATPRPIPKSVRHSPPWFGALVLVLLIGGVVVITVNYLAHLPFVAHGSPWGLVVGLVMIFAGFLLRPDTTDRTAAPPLAGRPVAPSAASRGWAGPSPAAR